MVARNEYYLLYKPVALEKWDMLQGLEYLAQELVKSGKFRIDADIKSNFVRCQYPDKGINIIFSYRELFDNNLIGRTKSVLRYAFSSYYSKSALDKKVEDEILRLKSEMEHQKIQPSALEEIKLARAVVQATEPVVIMLILAEGTEVFVSYSHTVGDMLDIESWQNVGSSSGLQTTDGKLSAVFISCGGNPFIPEKKRQYYGDGFRAISRLVVIGGQELGHYSDIIRDKKGRIVGRHSADLGGRRPSKEARAARNADIRACKYFEALLNKFHAKNIAELESHLRFYRKHRPYSIRILLLRIRIRFDIKVFFMHCKQNNMKFLLDLENEKYIATQVMAVLDDMQFNLTPEADAYKRKDPLEEEAIACIEALARVPQQMNKWGHNITAAMMPNLYHMYYRKVVPSCIEAYENITGYKYSMNYNKTSIPLKVAIKRFFNRKKEWLRTKPDEE